MYVTGDGRSEGGRTVETVPALLRAIQHSQRQLGSEHSVHVGFGGQTFPMRYSTVFRVYYVLASPAI